jgi:Raf kinase inhibitor-like YbhB/YbcL family protein
MKKTPLFLLTIGILSGNLYAKGPEAKKGAKAMDTITIESAAFGNMQPIPSKYTCDGADISPPLSWTNVPAGTKSLALICDDPDAPAGTWVHWVVYDLPPMLDILPENVPKSDTVPGGGKQGKTDFGRAGWGGPCPPSGTHRYFFKIYALDIMLNLPAGKARAEVEKAMRGHVVAQGELVGTYKRK